MSHTFSKLTDLEAYYKGANRPKDRMRVGLEFVITKDRRMLTLLPDCVIRADCLCNGTLYSDRFFNLELDKMDRKDLDSQ